MSKLKHFYGKDKIEKFLPFLGNSKLSTFCYHVFRQYNFAGLRCKQLAFETSDTYYIFQLSNFHNVNILANYTQHEINHKLKYGLKYVACKQIWALSK